jgi:hypothetical protein
MKRIRVLCVHNQKPHYCKQCKATGDGGNSLCDHYRRKDACKECKGSSRCDHGRLRSQCLECHGGSICRHNRQRARCSVCKPAGAYKTYQRNAKKLGRQFLLTLEDFLFLVASECEYCGRKPEQAGGMGVDRVDNSLGYLFSNCVSCCEPCNDLKRVMGIKEFLTQVELIAEHQRRKRNHV